MPFMLRAEKGVPTHPEPMCSRARSRDSQAESRASRAANRTATRAQGGQLAGQAVDAGEENSDGKPGIPSLIGIRQLTEKKKTHDEVCSNPLALLIALVRRSIGLYR
jgi:hypothetical protein